jgi:hypothetical protein
MARREPLCIRIGMQILSRAPFRTVVIMSIGEIASDYPITPCGRRELNGRSRAE